jgi:hypothetical protein
MQKVQKVQKVQKGAESAEEIIVGIGSGGGPWYVPRGA